MKLGQLPFLTVGIEIGQHTVQFKGISTADLAVLLPKYGAEIATLFGAVIGNKTMNEIDMAATFKTLVTDAPELVADVIALAAEDYSEDGIAFARRLPVLKQIEALDAIYRATFTSESDVKKAREVITKAVLALAATMEQMAPMLLSAAGIGQSGEK